MNYDNPLAFPTSNGGSPDDGMTLRDFFAAMAMAGLCADHTREQVECAYNAKLVYEIANAMLKDRSK